MATATFPKALSEQRSLRHGYWTRVEESLLHELAETMPLRELVRTFRCRAAQRGLRPHRSRHAIATKLQRLGYALEPQVDGLSAGQIAGALGIDRKTVGNWIRSGKLLAQRRASAQGWYAVSVRELCRFTCSYRETLMHLDLDDEAWRWLLSLFDEFL
jgi:hypothetical protein